MKKSVKRIYVAPVVMGEYKTTLQGVVCQSNDNEDFDYDDWD